MRLLNPKIWATKMFLKADQKNRSNIIKLLSGTSAQTFLDVGCDDGVFTMQCAKSCSATNTHGVEVVESAAELATANGVNVQIANLERALPYPSDYFDFVISNQVIEHVPNIDLFLSEIQRVLKSGGHAVISTENGSSWVNIAASIMGWQQFSLTNLSTKKGGIGNPMALHRNKLVDKPTWTHKTIFNYRGLIEFAEAHDFTVEEIIGAGYFPFPNIFSLLDTRHSHFITILVRKNLG